MSQTYFSSLRRLKATITSGGPNLRTVDLARSIVGNDKELDRAFWDLAYGKPEWLEPMIAQNLFATAPAKQSDGHRAWYPHWPAARYLASIANQRPADVANVILSIQTNNARVHFDFIHAAMSMPVEHGRRLVPHLVAARDIESVWMWMYAAGEWCAKLAKESPADAFVLLEALFAPGHSEDDDFQKRSEAFSKRALGDIGDDLTRADAERYIGLMVRWLGVAVERRDGEGLAAQPDRDWSVIWRPAIEEHEQNSDVAEPSWLTGLLVRACELAVREGKLSMNRVLQILAEGKTTVFKRVRIHLINRFADQDPDLARATIMDRSLYDSSWAKHEYAELTNERFGMLDDNDQARWLKWVADGPDMAPFEQSVRERRGADPSDEDRRQYRDWRRYERLHTIRNHLTGRDKAFYDRMRSTQGEPELANFVIRSRSGIVTPEAVSFEGTTFEEVMKKLRSSPSDDTKGAGMAMDSLRTGFEKFLTSQEDRFSAQAAAMIGQEGTFVYSFLRAQVNLAKSGEALAIASLLTLCKWVVSKEDPPRLPGEENLWSERPWRDCHAQVAEFIKALCKVEDGKAPRYAQASFANDLLGLLDTLCKASSGSALVESAERDPRQRDWLDAAINSVRGRAVEALLEFMNWRASLLNPQMRNSFSGDISQFRSEYALLEWQLDKTNRTVEGLAPIGTRMGLLYVLNKEWLKDRADDLFPLPPVAVAGLATDWAVWNSFLVWGSPHKEFFSLFREKYALAVQHSMTLRKPNDRAGRDPMPKLGEHLMVLYGRGDLGPLVDADILIDFITKGPPALVAHAMAFVGQSLVDQDDLPKDVVERFRVLWDLYWKSKGGDDIKLFSGYDLFGCWFASGYYKPDWSLPRLVEYAKLVGVVDPEEEVAKELLKVGGTNTETATEALRLMVEGASDQYEVADLFRICRPLLETALKAGGPSEMHARAAIDRLGRLGILEAGELLPD